MSARPPTTTARLPGQPLTVAWISDYPVEWMPDLPGPLRGLPRQHPATWAMVLLDEFKRREDLRVHVIALRGKALGHVSFEREGATYHVLKAPAYGRLLTLFWWDTFLIRKLLKRINPDVVHAWGTERGAALIAGRLGRPYVATMQGLLTWYARMDPDANRFMKLMARFEGPSLRRARVATAESRFAVRYLRERHPRLHVVQAEHAPNPVFYQVARRPEVDPPRMICVATLGYRKGTDLLLAAAQRLAADFDFRLTLVSGPCKADWDALQPRFPASLWERVEIKTHLPPAQVAEELGRATLLVMPTRADNSPNAVKEAVVAGVPVVASDIGGIPDYITHGENGLLFAPGDADALTRALREALLHPLFGRGQVKPETLQRARDYLSPARMAGCFLEAYQTGLRAWGAAPADAQPFPR